MKNRKQNQGFTLIELMIVIAIIGILAAVALPAYQDYIAKAEAIEVVNFGTNAKSMVAAYYMEENEFPTNAVDAGFTISDDADSATNIDDASYVGTAALATITIDGSAGAADFVVELRGTSAGRGVQWACTATSGGTWAPNECK